MILLGNIFLHPLAKLLGSTPQIHDEAISYLWYIVTFSPFLLFSFLLGGLARNDGRPKLAMFALAFGSVSNIVLDYVFMYPLNMGIAGAALATALGPIFSVLILLPHFLMKKGNLYFAGFRICFHDIQRIFTLGFPAFIMEFTIGMEIFVYRAAWKHAHPHRYFSPPCSHLNPLKARGCISINTSVLCHVGARDMQLLRRFAANSSRCACEREISVLSTTSRCQRGAYPRPF